MGREYRCAQTHPHRAYVEGLKRVVQSGWSNACQWGFRQYGTTVDATTGAHKHTLTGHTSRVSSVSFSPDGLTLASGSQDNTVRLWDATTGTHKHTLTGHTSWVYSVSFSPDGLTLASGSWQEIRLWDANTGAHKHTLTGHTGGVNSVAFSPDGRTLASGSRTGRYSCGSSHRPLLQKLL